MVIPVMNTSVITPFVVQNFRSRFIDVVQMYLDRSVYRHVKSHSQKCSVKGMEEFKRGEDVFEEVEKFFYHDDMFHSYGGASEVIVARIVSVWIGSVS